MKAESFIYFLIGFFSCALLVVSFFGSSLEVPFGFEEPYNGSLVAPSDIISEDEIIVMEDLILLRISGASISSYAPTGSMIPLFNEGANGIRIVPKSEQDIEVGDIVSFRHEGLLIVHRVIEKGIDDEGVYFVTKGDANTFADGKVRFSDIEYVTVGVIW